MSTDIYKTVLFNDGEELTYGDLNNLGRFTLARAVDSLLPYLVPQLGTGDPEFTDQLHGDISTSETPLALTAVHPATIPTGPYAYTANPGQGRPHQGSANNKIRITAGTIYQLVAQPDGAEPQFLSFTFDGTTELTIANGDASNPRVDLLQMKLEWVNGGSESRIFDTAPMKASLDLGTVTTHVDTVIRAKVPGKGGDNISIALTKRLSGSGVTYSESGNAITVLYEDGVSTVANFETALASSTLIEIESAGTPGNIFSDPSDTITATHLATGEDQLLVTQSMNKTRRVQCTLSMKQGTAASSPTYPAPDAGYVVIAGIVVGTSYAGAAGMYFEDTAGAVAVMHDQRMPLGVQSFPVIAKDFAYTGSDYAESHQGLALTASGTAVDPLDIHATAFSAVRRLVGFEMTFKHGSSNTGSFFFECATWTDSSGLSIVYTQLGDTGISFSPGDNMFHRRQALFSEIQGLHAPSAGPTVQQNANGMGPPIWSDAMRAPYEFRRSSSASILKHIIIRIKGSGLGETVVAGTQFGPAVFYFAGGLM